MAGIFKAYDIRGVYGEDLSDELAYKLGRAFIVQTKARTVVVGHDMRLSGENLAKALMKGINEQGADVIDIGLCSTPMMYYAVGTLDGCSIMVTASHNPAKYNGFKMTKDGTVPLNYEEGIQQIEELVKKNKFPKPARIGCIEKKDILDDYVKYVLKFASACKKKQRLKIVVDAGNGMSGMDAPRVFENLDVDVIPMYFELDGTFPNHEANPLKPENMVDLQKRVKKEKADLGIAFDGDADRVMFTDEKGDVISPDIITILIAKQMLKQSHGGTVLYDLRSSWAVKEAIRENKGHPIMTRVGHAYIKTDMRKTGALFAGELSGHYYFKDNFFCDSGIIATMKVLSIICSTDKKVSEIVAPYKRYFASGEINSDVKDKDSKIAEIEKEYKPDSKSIMHLDGLTVECADWWFNLRPSNTEPLLRLNVEAKTKKMMEQKRDELLKLIRKKAKKK
jgi:phosphomannomutase